MSNDKEKEKEKKELDSENIFVDGLSVKDRLQEKYGEQALRTLLKIAYYISKVGLPLEDACTITSVEKEKLEILMETDPLLRKVIEVKQLEYKKDLLSAISRKIREGDDKLALQFLEMKYPQEFSKKRKKLEDRDFMSEVIDFIQENEDIVPLVKLSSGKGVRPEDKEKYGKNLIQSVKDLLG